MSRYRLQGTQGARLYTIYISASLGPARAPWRARSGRSRSPANWQGITRSLTAEPEPRKTMENPHFASFCSTESHTATTLASSFPRSYRHGTFLLCVCGYCKRVWCVCVCVRVYGSAHLCAGIPHSNLSIFACCCCIMSICCITPSLKLSRLLCFVAATVEQTAAAHQADPFVKATAGASVCVGVRFMFPIWNEHVISGEMQGCCRGSRAIPVQTTNPHSTLLGDFKSFYGCNSTGA